MHKFSRAALISVLLGLLCRAPVSGAESDQSASHTDALQLWKIQKMLTSKKYVDLTHAFAPGIPRWPGFPDETRKTIYWYEKRPDTMGSGFFSELFTHAGQWGTHVDRPAHFIKGLRTVLPAAVTGGGVIQISGRDRQHARRVRSPASQ